LAKFFEDTDERWVEYREDTNVLVTIATNSSKQFEYQICKTTPTSFTRGGKVVSQKSGDPYGNWGLVLTFDLPVTTVSTEYTQATQSSPQSNFNFTKQTFYEHIPSKYVGDRGVIIAKVEELFSDPNHHSHRWLKAFQHLYKLECTEKTPFD
jgi:hypothetical protein